MRIVKRAEWGARHRDGFGPAPVPCRGLVLHHTVTPPRNGAGAVQLLERIGQDRFGGGISYTFVVTPDGTLYEGHSIGRRGAHTRGMNSTVRAVALVGNYSDQRPPAPMLDAVAQLLVHGRNAGWWPAAQLLGGHRQLVGGTACPGDAALACIGHIDRMAAGHADYSTAGGLDMDEQTAAQVRRIVSEEVDDTVRVLLRGEDREGNPTGHTDTIRGIRADLAELRDELVQLRVQLAGGDPSTTEA